MQVMSDMMRKQVIQAFLEKLELDKGLKIKNLCRDEDIYFRIVSDKQSFGFNINVLFHGIVGEEGFAVNVPASNVNSDKLADFLKAVQDATEVATSLNNLLVRVGLKKVDVAKID